MGIGVTARIGSTYRLSRGVCPLQTVSAADTVCREGYARHRPYRQRIPFVARGMPATDRIGSGYRLSRGVCQRQTVSAADTVCCEGNVRVKRKMKAMHYDEAGCQTIVVNRRK